MAADLVVDATGRGSHAPGWLGNLGFERPAESEIEIGLGYTTWEFPRAADDLAATSRRSSPPPSTTPGSARCWPARATAGRSRPAATSACTRSPTDIAAFRAFAAALPAPDIGDLVAEREPLAQAGCTGSPAAGGGTTRSCAASPRLPGHRRRAEQLQPAYGQGMTVAAVEAAGAARDAGRADGGRRWPRRFFRRAPASSTSRGASRAGRPAAARRPRSGAGKRADHQRLRGPRAGRRRGGPGRGPGLPPGGQHRRPAGEAAAPLGGAAGAARRTGRRRRARRRRRGRRRCPSAAAATRTPSAPSPAAEAVPPVGFEPTPEPF